jgi:tetratricopeptide (TPR) repeat protein
MSQATFSVDQVLRTPFPSFHKPLELARTLNRSGEDAQRLTALRLLDGLRKQYPHVLAVGQEFVLALIESGEPDRAELALKSLEHTFANLDEETLCRWGRLFKDRGDDYLELPGAVSNRFAPNRDRAQEFYRRSLDKYDQAFEIRSGPYPGINKATLLLILGSLKAQQTGLAPGSIKEFFESEELARKLLECQASWNVDHPDDETIWHSATAGEAQLLLREWTQAAVLYREALNARNINQHARESMLRQVERILAAFRSLGVAIPPPFDDITSLFTVGRIPHLDAAPESSLQPGGSKWPISS